MFRTTIDLLDDVIFFFFREDKISERTRISSSLQLDGCYYFKIRKMDWTSVFVEDGNEDLIIPQLIQQRVASGAAPRLGRLVSKRYHRHHRHHEQSTARSNSGELPSATMNDADFVVEDDTDDYDGDHQHRLLELASYYYSEESTYTLQSVYFISINFIFGVGLLGIPYAFAKAGFILCLVLLFAVTLFSYMTVMWVAETGARYEKLVLEKKNDDDDDDGNALHHEDTPLVTTLDNAINPDLASKYEVIDLVEFFLGNFQKGVYQVALLALMYIGLLAYSQVFCNALAAILWSTTGIPQIIFALMVVPLSTKEFEEQIGIQSIMAAVRFVAVFIIAFGSLMALFLDDSRSNRQYPPYLSQPHPDTCQMSYTACFSGFGVAFSTFVFAQLFQHSVPGLLRPLRLQPGKLKRVPTLLGGSLMTTTILYVLLGTLAASFFGIDTKSSINLNFANFTFGVDPENTFWLTLLIVRFCAGVVVIFPALDTISVFPLVANTLGNNLLSTYGTFSIRKIARLVVHYNDIRVNRFSWDSFYSGSMYDSLTLNEKRKILEKSTEIASILWKLVAALPPILFSLTATDLSFSLQLAGIAGIHIAFVAPSFLQIRSTMQFREEEQRTIFSGWYSSPECCIPVLLFGTFSFFMVIWQIWISY
jgi:amino acid permease